MNPQEYSNTLLELLAKFETIEGIILLVFLTFIIGVTIYFRKIEKEILILFSIVGACFGIVYHTVSYPLGGVSLIIVALFWGLGFLIITGILFELNGLLSKKVEKKWN